MGNTDVVETVRPFSVKALQKNEKPPAHERLALVVSSPTTPTSVSGESSFNSTQSSSDENFGNQTTILNTVQGMPSFNEENSPAEPYEDLPMIEYKDTRKSLDYSVGNELRRMSNVTWAESRHEQTIFDTSMIEQIMSVDICKEDHFFINLRKYLIKFQELRGMTDPDFNFYSLIGFTAITTLRCLKSLFLVLFNILPILEILLFVLRFVIDKLLDIKSTEDLQQSIIKIAIFCLQMTCVYIALKYIFGFIMAPVLHMGFTILAKFMLRY